jgi:hypothetical protein
MQVWGVPLQRLRLGASAVFMTKAGAARELHHTICTRCTAISPRDTPHVSAVSCHGYSQSGCALLCLPVLLETAASHSPCLERHAALNFECGVLPRFGLLRCCESAVRAVPSPWCRWPANMQRQLWFAAMAGSQCAFALQAKQPNLYFCIARLHCIYPFLLNIAYVVCSV